MLSAFLWTKQHTELFLPRQSFFFFGVFKISLSFGSKLFIHFLRIFVKFIDKNTECTFSKSLYIFFTLVDLCDEKNCLERGSTFTFT